MLKSLEMNKQSINSVFFSGTNSDFTWKRAYSTILSAYLKRIGTVIHSPENERGGFLTVIRGIAFVLSTVGFWEILRHRFSFHESFLPVLTIVLQSCLLLLAGLLNVLLETVVLLEALGLAGFIYFSIREKAKNLKKYIRVEFVFLALFSLILIFHLR